MRHPRPSRIVVAPNAFKGTLHCFDVAAAIAEGLRRELPDATIEQVPIADGGDDTLDVLSRARGGATFRQRVVGPLGDSVEARWAGLPDGRTAIIESAEASGLRLVAPAALNPLVATSQGTGELIMAALDMGYRRLIIGLGGSATVDGGAGMLQALGARLLDAAGRDLSPGGGQLSQLRSVDLAGLDARLWEVEIVAACDVDSPLIGPRGAAPSFGPQKGADPAMVRLLAANLDRLGSLLEAQLGRKLRHTPSGGAAGGMGAALLALPSATLRPGIELVLELLDFDARLAECDLVITGEGKLDLGSWGGKGPVGVANAARCCGVPCVAIVGQLERPPDVVGVDPFIAIVTLVAAEVPVAQAMREPYPLLVRAAEDLAQSLFPA
ncbi:MAG: glycerate 2-kinase [Chloroflexota bacterium]|nr:glycerate 2-kinase [Chloroflexota bacterium]